MKPRLNDNYESLPPERPDPPYPPSVETLNEARDWIQRLHRWSCMDSSHLWALDARIRAAEAPWWRPGKKNYWMRWYEYYMKRAYSTDK